VAGQRLLAPPSNFSKEGGFRKRVFRGVVIDLILSFMAANRAVFEVNSGVVLLPILAVLAAFRRVDFVVSMRI
jgi:hypothetical protein